MIVERARARDIQRGLLPVRLPDFQDFSLRAFYEPTDEVAGDFYDIAQLSDGSLCVFLCDVTGHGVPAAMIAAMAKLLFSVLSSELHSPARFLTSMNDLLTGKLANNFITCFCGVFQKNEKGEPSLKFATAGHHTPLLIRGQDARSLSGVGGPAIGLFAGRQYRESSIALEAEDRIFLYTDGLTEVFNDHREMFENILAGKIATMSDLSLQEQVLGIVRAAADFQGFGGFADDVTLVGIEVYPPRSAA